MVCVALERERFLAAGRVPHLQRLVPAAAGDPLAVGLKATLVTQSVCPLSVSISWPLAASHTFTVLSALPLTIRLPSGLKATLITASVWPLSVSISWPLVASHTFSVLSSLPLAIRFPSGLKATLIHADRYGP